MRKFLIATHGIFARGIKSSLDLIIGETDNIFLVQAYVDGNTSIEEDLGKVLENIGPQDELVVFTDLLGGSITNQVLRYALKENVHIVSGVNLPLLIDIVLADSATPAEEVIESALTNAREQLVYVNKLITANNGENSND
jgi:mannose/fructose-specific phosphotransferase system component IIA